jgi:hypothetical protein
MVDNLKPLNRYAGQMVAIIVALFGCFSLYYGCAMLMVPLFPREPDFARTIALFIVLPILLSVACFLLGAWLWSRTTRTVITKAFIYVFFSSIGIVVLIFVALAIGAHSRR